MFSCAAATWSSCRNRTGAIELTREPVPVAGFIRPAPHVFSVRDVYLNAGAGFMVVLSGEIMTMPGLPKKPASDNIDIDADGNIVGLA